MPTPTKQPSPASTGDPEDGPMPPAKARNGSMGAVSKKDQKIGAGLRAAIGASVAAPKKG